MALVVCTSSFVYLHRHYPGVLSSESPFSRVGQRVLTTCYTMSLFGGSVTVYAEAQEKLKISICLLVELRKRQAAD